jgi:hypothetical protein
MIELSSLNVIQNQLRNLDQMCEMIKHVSEGGYFHYSNLLRFNKGKESSLIEIAEFEDGKYYVHNGHHRSVAIWLGGRNHLQDGEYYIKRWKYDDYNTINMERQYVTPFDPRTQVRLPDFSAFKRRVLKLKELGEELTIRYIYEHNKEYRRDKTIFSVPELSKTYLNIQCRNLKVFTRLLAVEPNLLAAS